MRTLFFIALLVSLQPAVAQADPRLGAWTLTSAQSSFDPPNRLTITPVQDSMHVVMSGETHLDFTVNGKGRESAAPGNAAFNQVELHRINKKQAEVKEKKDGAPVATIREKLSADSNELTTTTTVPGKADQVTVWTRMGGVKVGNDLFAGEWTQDISKTRMRQASTLKIESDGRGGVHFSGDSTYTAHLDGKPNDLKNSRNDSVALQVVDSRTVDATYRRDNQVSQKERWIVSADGQQMTVSSSGSLETGQHFTEKLVFKKQ